MVTGRGSAAGFVDDRPAGSGAFDMVFVDDGTAELPLLTRRLQEFHARFDESGRSCAGILLHSLSSRRSWPGAATPQQIRRWEREVRRLEELPTLTVAWDEGSISGPALDLLLAADYRIAAADAVLSLAFDRDACWPGMALYRLVNQLGYAQARRLAVLGLELPATEAVGLGLVDEATDDPDAALARAAALARRLSGPEIAIRRRLALEASASEYDDALGVHLAACAREADRRERRHPRPDRSQEPPRSGTG